MRWRTTVVSMSFIALLHCGPNNQTPPRDGATSSDVARAEAGESPARDAALADRATIPDVVSADARADVAQEAAPMGDPYDAAREACVAEINRYRAMVGRPPYQRWREGEACADQMAANDARTGTPHDGFQRSLCSPRGNGQNECPRYGGPDALPGCLAQMWAEGPTPDGSWDVAHGHYMNMLGEFTLNGTRVQFSRVACGYSSAGWMLQNFQ